MNLKESIELVASTAVKAAALQIHPIPGDPRTVLVSQNGMTTERKLPRPLIDGRVETIADLLELAHKGETPRELWHTSERVVLLLDADDRRERVTMELFTTAVWDWLCRVADEGPFGVKIKQAAFATLLRTLLADAVAPDEAAVLLASLRAVTFRKREEASTEADRTRNALGRSIEQECAGVDKLPEFLTVTTRVWRNVESGDAPEVSIRLLIQVDFDNQGFTLSQCGEAVSNAALETQAALGGTLGSNANELLAVYQGTP